MSNPAISPSAPPRLTPWVGRLMVANAAVAVLLLTVFTAPSVLEALRFEPATAIRQPWTFISHLFVHPGLAQLALNLLVLYALGPAVERRMGGRTFLLFYIYCGIGAAAFGLGLSAMMSVPPLTGASGAALGIALAFAMAWPQAEIDLSPFPGRIGVKALVLLMVAADLLVSLADEAAVAHLAHLGGIAAAYLFLRAQALRRVERQPAAPPQRRAVLAPISVGQKSPVELRPAARPEPREAAIPEELDRVLDKISASGIESLTAEERRFLADAAERKRREVQ